MGGHLVLPPQRKGQLRQRDGRRVDWDPRLREQQCKGTETRSHKDSLWLKCKAWGRDKGEVTSGTCQKAW